MISYCPLRAVNTYHFGSNVSQPGDFRRFGAPANMLTNILCNEEKPKEAACTPLILQILG